MRKWVGPRIYSALWRPLLVGKFGEQNLDVVNMAWLWSRIHARTTRLGTFVGGFQAFLDKLADHLRVRGVDIRLSTPVTRIQTRRVSENPSGLIVETADSAETYDAVISTSSPALMARLMPDLPASYADSLRSLKSMGAVVLVVTLDRQLTEYYWHNLPKDAGFPYLAMVEHTNFIGTEHYGGDHILYLGDYLDTDHEYFTLSKEELLERFLPSLKRFNPAFDRSWVKDSVAVEDPLRTACSSSQSLQEHSAAANARAWSVLCQHEPGLPVGPRHELCGGDRTEGGGVGAGGLSIKILKGKPPIEFNL